MLDVIRWLKKLYTALTQVSDLIYAHKARHRPGGGDPLFPADFDINPAADNTYNLGSSTYRWANLYLAGNAYVSGKVYAGGGLYFGHVSLDSYPTDADGILTRVQGQAVVIFDDYFRFYSYWANDIVAEIRYNDRAWFKNGIISGGSIVPSSDNAVDLGSSSNRWRTLYAVSIYGALISLD